MGRQLPLAALVLGLLLVDCGPPPQSVQDLPPCTMLRRQVCGPQDECVNPGPNPNSCEECKARLCAFVRSLEARNEQAVCLVEWRSNPEYPLCRAPSPLPTLPPPPFLDRVQCEAECSPIPYPPKLLPLP
ncbi:MAG: hypothetical protein AB2A00_31060 [Myxococcota bacterium]